MRTALAALLLAALPAVAGNDYPGYGVVQSIKRLSPEPSASAGASAPGKKRAATYLVRVKMDDGSVQVRQVKSRDVGVGQRVLVTNAGDVLPE